MKIKILGSGREIGKSAVLIDDNKARILLDCGVKINPEPPQYPPLVNTDACIISHAHLDHCGAAPMLCKNGTQFFMNDLTLELSRLLIEDSIKISKKEIHPIPFSRNDLKKMIKNTNVVSYGEEFKIRSFSCKLYRSGHIPGSSGILMDNGKKIFYTSDIQTLKSNLLNPCKIPETDILIIESTYGIRFHPSRKMEEQNFIDSVQEALDENEIALIPVFAIGRSQEILILLEKYANKIAVDGMVRKACNIMNVYGRYLKDAKRFRNVLKKVKFIQNNKERETALKKYPIIISSAGMLGGGPVVRYLQNIQKQHRSQVLFCGFLAEDSPGRNLMETSIFRNNDNYFRVHSTLKQFDLSAHADREGLFNIIKRANPSKIICVHGDYCKEFAEDIEKEFGIPAIAPKNNEVVKI